MNKRFVTGGGSLIAGIMAGQTPQELIAEARNARSDGAQGIAIDLSDLRPEFRNRDSLARVIGSVDLPFLFFFYRDDKQQGLDDDARQVLLLDAADAGAAMIDVMGDLYDQSPMDITHSPVAIAKQVQLIDRIHAKGAQVVISSHLDCPRNTAQVSEHLRALAERGSDVVKIVTTVNSEDELAEAMRTTMALKRTLGMPFIHLCSGRFSTPHRFLCQSLGTAISFAVHRYEPRYSMPQPRIQTLRAVRDRLCWSIDQAMSSAPS